MNVNLSLRKVITTLFISATLCLNAQQDNFIGGVLLNFNGIEFKGNSAQYWTSTNGTIWGALGVSAGLFVKREFTKKIYSILELRYINKGSIYEFTSQYGTPAFETLFLNYVEIPVLLGYKNKINKRTYYFESGFAYAKMISSNLHANELLSRTGTPNADKFESRDISWIGSFKFPLTKKWNEKLLFGLRVSHSIFSIHKYYKIYNFDYGIEFYYVFH